MHSLIHVVSRLVRALSPHRRKGPSGVSSGGRVLAKPASMQKYVFLSSRRKKRVHRLLCAVSCLLVYQLRATNTQNLNQRHLRTGRQVWLSGRSVRFAARWDNHKLRNLAVYACVSTSNVPLVASLAYHVFTCPEVFYSELWRKLFLGNSKWCVSHACLSRFGKNHFVYAEFVVSTYDTVVSSQVQVQAPHEHGKVAVLLEPREHTLFTYVVKQVLNVLGPEWGLHLFLSERNEQFARRELGIRPGDVGENIRVTPLSKFGFSEADMKDNIVQSALSLHDDIYKEIVGEYILWFQMDVLMRHAMPTSMLQWSYIGSEWGGCEYPVCSPKTCRLICGGGNSGFSFRRKSVFRLISTKGRLPEDLWGVQNSNQQKSEHPKFLSDELFNNSALGWFEDDLIISAKLHKLGLLPNGSVQSQFSISETVGFALMEIDPVGLHKPWLVPLFDVFLLVDLLQKPFDAILGNVHRFPP